MQIESKYKTLSEQARSLAEVENLWLPLLANMATLIYDTIGDVNWAGFYVVDANRLTLGPYKGEVACVSIAKGKGVCGTAWQTGETQSVPDVHAFPGHIACDAASRSEVVVPIRAKGEVVAVLDIDSPLLARFTNEDVAGIEFVAKTIEDVAEWRDVSF